MAATRDPHSPPGDVLWLRTGADAFKRMLPAIAAARHSIRFEMYIFRADETGESFRIALTAAAARGVKVRVLLDAVGSGALRADYWSELRALGGEVRIFNPLTPRGFLFRDHRKLTLIDDRVAFIGGFNVANEYNGDGVNSGWRDLGWELYQPEALRPLAAAFDGMFQRFGLRHRFLDRMRRPLRRRTRVGAHGPVLLGGPRVLRDAFATNLLRALRGAKNVQLVSGYFVPNFQLRRALRRVARRGGTVELILAGKSDVPIAQTAARALYGSLLRAGVRIYEYGPQILHAKMAIVDDIAYVGSANLDIRSFGINYELMVRVERASVAAEARAIFAADQQRSVEVTRPAWSAGRGWLDRLRGHWAVFFFTKIDPWLVRQQLRSLG